MSSKVSFTDDLNIRPARLTYPRFNKLTAGEKRRIQVVKLDEIEEGFVFSLNAPVVIDGKPVYTADGKLKMEFKGNPLSTGDISILRSEGIDTKNCLVSQYVKKYPEYFDAPKRKFAIRIVEYRTKPNSYEVQKPFSVTHKIWVVTDRTFAKLQELHREYDLTSADLMIECTNQQFQTYDIVPARSAAMRENDETKKHTAAEYLAGKDAYPDLSGAIGSVKEQRWLKQDLEDVVAAYAVVNNENGSSSQASSGLDDVFSSIVADNASESIVDDVSETFPETYPTESVEETSFEDLLAEI